mgnify:CR=1 FL=1
MADLHTGAEAPSRTGGSHFAGPAIDIILVIIASIGGYILEGWMIENGVFPLGPGARGLTGIAAGIVMAVALTFMRGKSWADLGFRRPRRYWTIPLWVAGILAVFFAAQVYLPQLLAPYFDLPAADMSRHAAIQGNLAAAVTMALVLPITASIPEEIIYRGFLMDRLGMVFGQGAGGTLLTIIGQAVFFSAAHFGWGAGGLLLTFVMGLIWGSAYILTGRNLWIMILTHSTGHVIWVFQLYRGAVG